MQSEQLERDMRSLIGTAGPSAPLRVVKAQRPQLDLAIFEAG